MSEYQRTIEDLVWLEIRFATLGAEEPAYEHMSRDIAMRRATLLHLNPDYLNDPLYLNDLREHQHETIVTDIARMRQTINIKWKNISRTQIRSL